MQNSASHGEQRGNGLNSGAFLSLLGLLAVLTLGVIYLAERRVVEDTEHNLRVLSLRTPPRILVVDDDPTNVEVLRVRLSAQGYEVITAADGDEALQRARALEPDLVLLDVMMPKLDGISVLKELKADTTPRFVPVIMVTAKAETRDIVSGLEAGGDDYITKPFEQAALVARVRSLLRIKELHDTAQLQAAQLKQQTDELSSWNRLLEERVAEQLAQVERIGRLQQFLAPQVAQMIASSNAPDSPLESHRREVTALFCDLRGFTAFTEGPSRKRSWRSCGNITRAWGSLSSDMRAH